MRELSAYFCPRCGHYAYFQLPKNAVCCGCHVSMKRINMPYQNFMDMNREERDRYISCRIIEASPSLAERISAPDKLYNQRRLIGQLTEEYTKLETENQSLNQTVDWMHKTIWEQLHRMKELEYKLREMEKRREM